MRNSAYVILAAVVLFGIATGWWFTRDLFSLPTGETEVMDKSARSHQGVLFATDEIPEYLRSEREKLVTDGVVHTIPLEEIRQGCFGRDCIPSVDNPEFISTAEANELLPEDSVGIGLLYKGEARFYPFDMLVTREIVNDTVAGDPLVVTYCPLCGTGVVYDRVVEGKMLEFGVSGLLWQSNLLMYNRTEDPDDATLWSQVLGESVLGPDAGVVLEIVPSDIVRYSAWRDSQPDGLVLNTGNIRDPYNGDYWRVAKSFRPSFNEEESPLEPTAYVYGIEVQGVFKAYPQEALSEGEIIDEVGGEQVTIKQNADGSVVITDEAGKVVPDIEGFWFSWVAAHPETELFTK